MEDWSAGPDVVAEVRIVRERFLESLTRIDRFLTDAEHGFEKVSKTWASIRGKFARVGPDQPLLLEGGESLELESSEVRAMLTMIDESRSHAEHHPGMLAEMALVSLFASYDAFLSDLLTTVFRARPEILRSSKRITAESVISATSLDELVEELIAREVEDWRLSLREQIARMDQRFGLQLSRRDDEIAILSEAHERRHLFVHRGGIVDRRYLSAVPQTELARGVQIGADVDYWRRVKGAMATVALQMAVDLPATCLRIESAELEGSTG